MTISLEIDYWLPYWDGSVVYEWLLVWKKEKLALISLFVL